jgi:hypothetical protein
MTLYQQFLNQLPDGIDPKQKLPNIHKEFFIWGVPFCVTDYVNIHGNPVKGLYSVYEPKTGRGIVLGLRCIGIAMYEARKLIKDRFCDFKELRNYIDMQVEEGEDYK